MGRSIRNNAIAFSSIRNRSTASAVRPKVETIDDKFNNLNNQECLLKQITVTPTVNCNTQTSDESMCSNYENDNL